MHFQPAHDSTPTDDAIEAIIQHATASRSLPDGRLPPLTDTRTQLFVGNLPYRVRWQDLKDLFRAAGTVLRADVSLGPDNRSRGYGTVLLATAEDAGRAVDMFNGYTWQSRVLEVRLDRLMPDLDVPSRSFEDLGAPATYSGVHDLASYRTLFVGNLPFHCQWQDLKDLFRQAGTVLRADVALGPDGRSRGFGTVVFATEYDAARAVKMFNGLEFQGRQLKVHFDKFSSTVPSPAPSTMHQSPHDRSISAMSYHPSPRSPTPPDIYSRLRLESPLQRHIPIQDFPLQPKPRFNPPKPFDIDDLTSSLAASYVSKHTTPQPSAIPPSLSTVPSSASTTNTSSSSERSYSSTSMSSVSQSSQPRGSSQPSAPTYPTHPAPTSFPYNQHYPLGYMPPLGSPYLTYPTSNPVYATQPLTPTMPFTLTTSQPQLKPAPRRQRSNSKTSAASHHSSGSSASADSRSPRSSRTGSAASTRPPPAPVQSRPSHRPHPHASHLHHHPHQHPPIFTMPLPSPKFMFPVGSQPGTPLHLNLAGVHGAFSPGLAMSPGTFYGRPGDLRNPLINPAVGAPIHPQAGGVYSPGQLPGLPPPMVGIGPAHGHEQESLGARIHALSSPHPGPPREDEPKGYFDPLYFPTGADAAQAEEEEPRGEPSKSEALQAASRFVSGVGSEATMRNEEGEEYSGGDRKGKGRQEGVDPADVPSPDGTDGDGLTPTVHISRAHSLGHRMATSKRRGAHLSGVDGPQSLSLPNTAGATPIEPVSYSSGPGSSPVDRSMGGGRRGLGAGNGRSGSSGNLMSSYRRVTTWKSPHAVVEAVAARAAATGKHQRLPALPPGLEQEEERRKGSHDEESHVGTGGAEQS